jgi:ectoine hydroxylase-related dioxygenase (phytanoyl-CoA dioxygenase family)
MQPEELQEQLRELDKDGYAILRECLSPQSCNALANNFAADCYGQRELLTLESIRTLAASPEILSLASAALGQPAFAVSGTFFNKIPAANWKVPWHQDRLIKVARRFEADSWGPWSTKEGVVHVQPPASVISRVLAIRLHLDECPADNGALRVIPGSHKFGFLNAEEAAKLTNRNETVCEIPMGGALLMRPLLLHCSSPSKSAKARRVIHLEYASEALPRPFEWQYRVA